MGRKLEFSKEKALEQAMQSFWAQGYAATSMRDLADKLGLHLGSVYNALGDKDAVFESALRLHIDTFLMPHIRALRDSPDSMAAIVEQIDRVSEECTGMHETPGCFVTNSLLSITDINDTVTGLLHDFLAEYQTALAHAVTRAQDKGQIGGQMEAMKIARFIISNLMSMRIMWKLGIPNDMVHSTREVLLQSLRPQ